MAKGEDQKAKRGEERDMKAGDGFRHDGLKRIEEGDGMKVSKEERRNYHDVERKTGDKEGSKGHWPHGTRK